jgi:amino acid adenylation domain-containing protein
VTPAARDPGDGLPPSDWNSTARSYPVALLHQVFEAQVARRPDAAALRFRDETLTYAELDGRADVLARELAGLGAGPGTLVGVCLHRSLEMVVSLFAILKSGAAYVPIDPDYPAERVSFMLDDAGAPIVLTQSMLLDRIDFGAAHAVAVDGARDTDSALAAPGGSATTGPDDLAYVIYTSGSTGRPKGAMISHRAITNRIHWMQEAYALTPADRVLQKTPFSFDVSVSEFFWPLLFGAELVIAEPGGHRDTRYLTQTIIDRDITTIHFVPSMLELFLEDPRAGDCTSLKRVVCSGEALPRALQDRFFARLKADLHNLYGPTEAAVDVTAWACDPGSDLSFVPIGKPVANTHIHILDEDLRPVAVGTAGELHIGGVQVARGYLNRTELTAQRFIGDPFSEHEDARLYKTGDLARYRADGNIEFLGRSDFQVKIRGFRVELGEVEAALESAPGVRQAVVVAHERSGGDLELVAYVSHATGAALPIDDLRLRLAAQLPEYMVPTTFIPVERFALTANGKIDRKALPAPTRVRPPLETPYMPPRTALELLIAERWRDILDLDQVGIHDRFFELGGSSLQAARFVNQMQAEFGESIFVVTLFSAPSVAEYAAFLETQYPTAVARLAGTGASTSGQPSVSAPISEADLARFRSVVPTGRGSAADDGRKNPPAIFILSPPRSGTTLLRIMLAGHPELFSASELQLLGFATLRERADAYAGRHAGWLDGTVRTIMQVENVDADEARARMAAAEAEDLSTKQFYRRLQEAIHPRILVDKSPSYALDASALRRAESDFASPRYVHLVRHPAAMIDSFERHHMEQILYLHEHDWPSRRLAELVWTSSHRNIMAFLSDVPQDRWVRLHFEELVREPAAQMQQLCEGLGLAFDTAVLQPYEHLEDKMVDGVYAESAPMGDPGFLARGRIDASTAMASPASGGSPSLGEPTWKMAASLGEGRSSDGLQERHMHPDPLARQRELRRSARGRR